MVREQDRREGEARHGTSEGWPRGFKGGGYDPLGIHVELEDSRHCYSLGPSVTAQPTLGCRGRVFHESEEYKGCGHWREGLRKQVGEERVFIGGAMAMSIWGGSME